MGTATIRCRINTVTLEQACVNGVYDSYRMKELRGKKLFDFLPDIRLARKGAPPSYEHNILRSWCRFFRAKRVPYVVGFREPTFVRIPRKARKVRLFKELISSA